MNEAAKFYSFYLKNSEEGVVALKYLHDRGISDEIIEKFNPELAKCPQIVAGNKIDLATDEQREAFAEYIRSKGLQYYEIIAPIAEGTQELINAVRVAVENGINFFDTGKTYSDSEEKLGRVLSKVRDKVYIATKLPQYMIKTKEDMIIAAKKIGEKDEN